MNYKAIIIGASTSGKSTLVTYFRDIMHLPVSEIDEELIRMNGGTYPQDSKYKMDELCPKIVQDVINQDNIIFFTGTHYFRSQDLETARQKGFKILQLILDREQMEKRNKYRVENECYDDLSKYFNSMLEYQKQMKEEGHID